MTEAIFDLAKDWGMTVETTVYDCPQCGCDIHFGWCMYKEDGEYFASCQVYCTACDFREMRIAPHDQITEFTQRINEGWSKQIVVYGPPKNLVVLQFDIQPRSCATSPIALLA